MGLADLTEDEAVAEAAWEHAAALIGAGEHRLVVLDEVTYPVNWGWISPTTSSRPSGVGPRT